MGIFMYLLPRKSALAFYIFREKRILFVVCVF